MTNRNEAETRAELIDPALEAAGWGVVEQSAVRREFAINLGRLQGAGARAKKDIADYVLVYKNQQLAVIEAKREELPVTEGLGQAKSYADKLQTPFVFSTNGHGLYRVDMRSGEEGDVTRFPTPAELWDAAYGESEAREKLWRERFSKIPYHDLGGAWTPRYYQHNAVTKVMEAIATGQERILLTLATGTGKTAIAFQIAWKLYQSRWNIRVAKTLEAGQELNQRPRILFLTDRNILADQALLEFGGFPDDAIKRVNQDAIRKNHGVPMNASVFFTIFQTFMSGKDAAGNDKANFGAYPPDFFDLIVIDECHRGGANEESRWREIMNYFAPAVQLGLTATPRTGINADTYRYFGKPVYTYSLKEGINDGYLTPFRVKKVGTTIDDYIYVSDDTVMEGEVEHGRLYREVDFNNLIIIREREKKRVEIFMRDMEQAQKTLVFCATKEHALLCRDLINQTADSTDANYCARVTYKDGAIGEQHLRAFRDNEKTIPTVLTTSRKLSTGVDARNVRNIVLMRPVRSMIEFKQIIGRGTRIYDGKDYFTIYDFVRAYEHFSDPEWDGEALCERCHESPCICEKGPVPVCAICGQQPCQCERPPCPTCGQRPCVCEVSPRTRVKIRLADGKERAIQHMMETTFWHQDRGQISTVEFVEQLFGDLPALLRDEEELRNLWSLPATRKNLLAGLEAKGYGKNQLAQLATAIEAEKSDIYDVLAYIAYARAPLTRKQRADKSRNRILAEYHEDAQQEFLEFVLGHYVDEGVSELDVDKLPDLMVLKYRGMEEATAALGEPDAINAMFVNFQKYLYEARDAA